MVHQMTRRSGVFFQDGLSLALPHSFQGKVTSTTSTNCISTAAGLTRVIV